MNKILLGNESRITNLVPARVVGVRGWQRWAPYAAVVWSLIYAALGIYWAISGRGFPYATEIMNDGFGPLIGRLGPRTAWIIVTLAGIPTAALGVAMLRGMRNRIIRPFLITAGALIAGVLLLMMTGLNLLINLGYTPAGMIKLLTGDEFGQTYLKMVTQWTTIHQLICLTGGFLWLGATLSYIRRSGDACLVCGRRDDSKGWQSPDQAARWGRTAVYVGMAAPAFYALTRLSWVLGIPLGLSEEQFRRGTWVSGAISLGIFALVGGVLMLGLVQRWGEIFPRWMIGLAGRRVPIGLAVVPASLASVLLIVGGIGIWSGLGQVAENAAVAGAQGKGLIEEIIFQLGPTLLFPVWGLALAVATLGYYYRRRGPCSVCGRGALSQSAQP